MAEEFILAEDGFHLVLEDGSGDLLLESSTEGPVGGGSGRLGAVNILGRQGRVAIQSRSGRVSIGSRSGRVSI